MNKKDISIDSTVIQWLLEDENPAVKYRTQTEILDISKDNAEVKSSYESLLSSDIIQSIMALFDIGKDYSDAHALCAIAECGLTRNDVEIDLCVDRLITNTNFRDGCGEGLLLRNLIALGFAEHNAVKRELPIFLSTQQNDGGFPCISKNPKINKPNVPHKSCFQITVSYLLLTVEMSKKGIDAPQTEGIIQYFLSRDVLYRRDDLTRLIKECHASTFHPPVCTRIGLHMTLCALSMLGKGNDSRCKRAWELLYQRRDDSGKYILADSLTKPYIKAGKKGKPSKWVTFYALLAEKHRAE